MSFSMAMRTLWTVAKVLFYLAIPCQFHPMLPWVTMAGSGAQSGGDHKREASGEKKPIGIVISGPIVADAPKVRNDQADQTGEHHTASVSGIWK